MKMPPVSKLFCLPLLSLFLLGACSTDDAPLKPENPDTENPDGENPDEENPDETGTYIIPDQLADYYEGVDFSLEEEALYDELAAHTIAKHTTFLSYSDRHDYLYQMDADPQNPENVILIYSGEKVSWKLYQGNNPYTPDDQQYFNTEHIYPQSFLEENSANDLHVMRVAEAKLNSTRSNHPYADGEGQYKMVTSSSFYPGDEWRGDVARIVMYMNLRYNEPFEDVGTLELFLEWNAEDPVSLLEMQRNNVAEEAQGQRNPFLDNPHLATAIWGGEAADNRWDGNNEDEDTEAPSAPTAVTVSDPAFEGLTVTWEAASDNVGVTKYSIFLDGEYFATSTSTSIDLVELTPGTTYSITVTASDAFGNESDASEAVDGSTLSDDEAPTVPANLTATTVYATSIGVKWDASTDNAEVKNYDVYLNGEFFKTVYETEYTFGDLTPETAYEIAVLANDIYGNSSELTAAISVTTEKETQGGTTEGVIIISEYVEGSSYNKALEIANISDVPVDLSVYTLREISNEKTEWEDTFQLEGTLNPGEVLVIANDQASAEILDLADFVTGSGVVNFNGDDVTGLFLNGELIDMMGEIGDTPDYAKDVTLRRKSTVTAPSTVFTAEEWEILAKDTIDGLGKL